MPKLKCPYTFPHRTRKAMTDYLLDRKRYGGYAFAWNVKVYGDVLKASEAAAHDIPANPRFDAEWQAEVEGDNGERFYRACADAASYLTDKLYSTYPGDDQGDWEFGFEGRSSGWLVLTGWREHAMGRGALGCASDWIGELSFADLRTLYRGIRCMDSDFTRDKVLAEVAYHLRGQRADWEEINGYTVKQQDAAAEQSARDLERSRPDMYGWYSMQNGLPIAPGSPEPDIKVAP